MRAWNRKKKPKHWTKPKWYRKIWFLRICYVLKSTFMKEKINFMGLDLKKKFLNICIKMDIK